MAAELYENGYDVHLYNEPDCIHGSLICNTDLPEEEIRSAIEDRYVLEIALMGYSHGGGAVYQVWQEMQSTNYSRGYTLALTSYIDAIYWWDLSPQVARPTNSQWHINQYQNNTGISGAWLNGARSNPVGDDDIDRSYIAGINHGNIDNNEVVRDWNVMRVLQKVQR